MLPKTDPTAGDLHARGWHSIMVDNVQRISNTGHGTHIIEVD